MGLKYKSEYENAVGDEFKLEIYQDGFSGDVTEIEASVVLDYTGSDQFDVIRGCSITVDIEANQNMTFQDLYSDEERQFPVKFYMGAQVKFEGFLKPDDIYSDFVDQNWQISVDCVDMLGTLKGIEFNKDVGVYYEGDVTEMEVVMRCLQKTGMELPVNVRLDVKWDDGYPTPWGDHPVMENTFVRGERYFDNDGENKYQGTDCYRVLEAILEKYTAVIHQHNGQWWIHRPRYTAWKWENPQDAAAADNTFEVNWFRYENYNTNVHTSRLSMPEPTATIGSQVNNFYPHHVNANQSLETRGRLQAYQVKLDLGLLDALNENSDMRHDGNTIDGWTLAGNPDGELDSSGRGIYWRSNVPPTGWPPYNYEAFSDKVDISGGERLKFKPCFYNIGLFTAFYFAIEVTGSFSGYKYWYRGLEQWETESISSPADYIIYEHNSSRVTDEFGPRDTPVEWNKGLGDLNYSFELEMPSDAQQVRVFIFTPQKRAWTYRPIYKPDTEARLSCFEIIPASAGEGKDAELYTAFEDTFKSSKVNDTIDVMNGDAESPVYEGVLKNTDDETTQDWTCVTDGFVDGKPILSIMVSERLRTQRNIGMKFKGDVWGYFDYFNLIKIDGFDDVFQITNYSYDTVDNTVKMELEEVGTERGTADDVDVEIEAEYTDSVKPKIEGG